MKLNYHLPYRYIFTFAIILVVMTAGEMGCDANDATEGSVTDAASSSAADTDTAGIVASHGSTGEAALEEFFFRPDGTPAVEECCTNVGKMDECWWEDAISDGVTCTKDGDCPWAVAGACVKDVTSGSSVGVCKCRPEVITDCYDPDNGREGVCITDPDNPSSGVSLCGPSYCNGYLKCSCFGGCEWWDQDDLTNTPDKVAGVESADSPEQVFCCEGNYPWGGDTIVTFYGVGSCNPGESVECISNGECDDGNPCTADSCTISNTCEHTAAANNTPCGVDSDPTDCIGGNVCISGFCRTGGLPLAAGSSCGSGADTDTDDCVAGFECDTAANCVEMYDAAGSTCTIDETTYPASCWAGYCGGVSSSTWSPTFDTDNPDGLCYEIERDAPDNDSCASGGATVGNMGTFTNTQTGFLPSVAGSTVCANSISEAASVNCVNSSGTAFGIGSKDLVYSFGYTTTDTTQQQLYAFVVTIEADFRAVLYTETDACTDGVVDGHPCQWQPELDNGGPPVPWEYSANKMGKSWAGSDQKCDSTGLSGYQWCERGGGWTYPEDVTNCKFETDGSFVCDSAATYLAQTFVYPISDEAVSNHRVYIHVDGATAADEGNFTIKVERKLWNNGQCERVNDGPRVYDVTDASSERVYRGNLIGVANSDHSATDTTCAGYDCSATWEGKTAVHDLSSANAFWPNAAFFKIQPQSDTEYCVRVDNTGVTGAIDSVLEVRQLDVSPLNNYKDICQGNTSPVSGADAVPGAVGIDFVAEAGQTYLVMLSEVGPNSAVCASDCNYRLVVNEGSCGPSCTPTTYEAEAMTATVGGYDAPGWNMWSAGTLSTTHNFTAESKISMRLKGSPDGYYWPYMKVYIGGNQIYDASVFDSTYAMHQTTFAPVSGTQTITVENTYDSWYYGGDVNLWLDYLTVECPDPPSYGPCTDLTIEGEDMSHTVGAATADGLAWNIWGPGWAYEDVDMTEYDTVEVVVKGSNDGSIWPDMDIAIVSDVLNNTTVTNTSFASYYGDVSSYTGTQQIWVVLKNDSNVYGGDVNLYLDKVIFHCASSTPDPAPTTCTPQTIEGENMSATTGSASDNGWALWIPGSIYSNLDFSANTSISVSAKGSADGSIWPNMVVQVDGVDVMNTTVNTTSYSAYNTTFASASGTKEVKVSMMNDSLIYGGDVNLWIDNVTLGCDGSDTDSAIGVDTDTTDNCIPVGCQSAPTMTTIDHTGYYVGCLFVPYNASYHMGAWNWNPGDLESITVNGTSVNMGDYWAPGGLPAVCNGGWYFYVVFNTFDAHLEVKP